MIYAATGDDYVTLARRAARTLRRVMPGVAIDLFTDRAVDDPVFDRVHRLDTSWIRPKMEALRRSRFERTLYLDVDTVVLADLGDLFPLLDRCDIVGCWAKNRPLVLETEQRDIPRAFPYLNSGVLVVRRSPEMSRLLVDWDAMARSEHAAGLRHAVVDQFALRRLLYERHVSVMVLPLEYNLQYLDFLDVWSANFGKPQILHVRDLHREDPGDPGQPFDAAAILGPARATVLSGSDGPMRRPSPPLPSPRRRNWLDRLKGN